MWGSNGGTEMVRHECERREGGNTNHVNCARIFEAFERDARVCGRPAISRRGKIDVNGVSNHP